MDAPNLIAIVGRPNVGKSALFNRIVRKRIAIVHDQPGVTRDRISVETEWNGHPCTLVDTGGLGLLRGEKSQDVIIQAACEQVQLAIQAATVILLVVNLQEGVVSLDREVASRLRCAGKPVLVAVNKTDNALAEAHADVFSELGFERIFPVSAIHQRGISSLMDAAVALLPKSDLSASPQAPDAAPPLKLAVIGRPNVGKSSLINALTHSHRVIVTPIPGTTRDSVDVPFTVETEGIVQKYILIDTAGVRQERRVDDSVEFFSVKRTDDSIARCDIAVLVLDAQAGVTSQDKKVAGKIVECNKACLIIVNKWDLLAPDVDAARKQLRLEEKRGAPRREGQPAPPLTLAQFGGWVREHLFFLDYAPVIFTSATTGFHLDRMLQSIRYVTAQLRQKIPTAILNRTLQDAIQRRQPASAAGHRLKFFYATQVNQAPPVFLLFVNRENLLSDQYKLYLSHQIRAAFGYEGCPIILRARQREQNPDRPPLPSASAPPRPGPRHARDRSATARLRRSHARRPKSRR
ncbi:MAG: ribosome biogenesis GTPase Der [Verrucomicrobiota bacterium]|jgi:GTP-binding protein